MSSKTIDIRCSICHSVFKRDEAREGKHPLQFCAYCGSRLRPEEALSNIDPSSILLKEHAPTPGELVGTIGRYLLLKSIGRGGMGEVYLAFDTVCGRRVALKRIRTDYINSPQLRARFIREARITSQLIHPSIIPIYSIHVEHDLVYYTMPYVAGQTLKQLLAQSAEQELTNQCVSIPSLIRIFLNVIQAVAYAHSRGVLHRDIKPENVIIGTYGQVIILDWGLTKLLEEGDDEPTPSTDSKHDELLKRLTRLGKPVGTVPYMAPERVQGKSASKQTDIYALGVILYQILTLKLPFARKNMKNFLETWAQEEFTPPEVKAPYRDIPQALSVIVKKCLSPDPESRYGSCDELLQHIENFLEGRSEWYPARSLKVHHAPDWEFQENILLTEYSAIVRTSDHAEWCTLMVSKESFSETVRLDVSVKIGTHGNGVGFIFCAPDGPARHSLTEGYWLWLSTANSSRPSTLFRSTATVLEDPDLLLSPDTNYQIIIEKVEQTITLKLNGEVRFVYESHIPVVGTHVGLFVQDADVDIESMVVSIGSQNILVNCLAVPDAFLASREYDRALSEYRRIGASFSGRAEGRDALFRAGITLLEKGKQALDLNEQETLYDLSRHEFQKLRHTTGAPLEYLGKALVYQTTGEFAEEIKCLELAFRRYKHHPLLRVLIEHVVLRMHDSSRHNRVAAYQFVCFVLRFLPEIASNPSSTKLFESLHQNWEIPPFLLLASDTNEPLYRQHSFCLVLAFWLEKAYVASEIFEELISTPVLPLSHITDCLLLYVALGQIELLRDGLSRWRQLLCEEERSKYAQLFQMLSLFLISTPEELLRETKSCLQHTNQSPLGTRVLLLLMERALIAGRYDEVIALYDLTQHFSVDPEGTEELASRALESALATQQISRAEKLVRGFSPERLCNEASPLFFLYGCLLLVTKEKQAARRHFELSSDLPYPCSEALAAHVITEKLLIRPKGWVQRSFAYERHVLIRHLRLYSDLSGDESFAPYIELLVREDQR